MKFFDANGNVSQLLDQSGSISASYTYDPVGNVTEMAGLEAELNPWRFSTKPVDAGTGWLYYGFRYYNPKTGRWTSKDPIQEGGGMNLYGFVGNNGVGATDFLRLAWADCEKCATDIAKTLGHTVAAALQIAVGWRMFGKLQPNMQRGTRWPIRAAIGALVAGVLIKIHNGGNSIREAQLSCTRCCNGSPSQKTIEDLERQIERHEQSIEDLTRRLQELEGR